MLGGPNEGKTATEAVAYKVIERLSGQFQTIDALDAWLQDQQENEEKSRLDVRNRGADVVDQVVLSTIHQAKGREWPAVAVLGPSESMPDPRATTPGQQEEERRVAYVAATRARERLLFSCSAKYASELSRSPAGLAWQTYKEH